MKIFVNSGHVITHEGQRYHSGIKLPENITSLWNQQEIDQMVSNGVLTVEKPVLDGEIDAKTGSAAIEKSGEAPESENFATKQLSKELNKNPSSNKKEKK